MMSVIDDAVRSVRLFAGILGGWEVNKQRRAERARVDSLAVTELADTLVRGDCLNSRLAHHLVSEAVRRMNGRYQENQW